MPTVEDLIEVYRKFDDAKLWLAYKDRAQYSEEGVEALEYIIKERGGIDSIKNRIEVIVKNQNEIKRITREANYYLKHGKNVSEVYESIQSEILSSEEVRDIITQALQNYNNIIEDKKVDGKTINNGLFGGIIAGTIGGIFLYLIGTSGKIYYLFLVGVFMFCYTSVHLFTKKSNENRGVILISCIAFVYAIFLWFLLNKIFLR